MQLRTRRGPMIFKAPSVGAKDLSAAVAAAIKTLPREVVAGPKVIIRPEIIGIIIREQLDIKTALGTATTIARGITAASRGNEALAGLKVTEPGLLITNKGILAGFFPSPAPTFEI